LCLISIICLAGQSISEPDPFIDNIAYSREGYEEVILVEDGRDNATFFKYLIIDDYSEAPENWSEVDYNDSAWLFGAAPFGDRDYNGVTPNTDWDTYRNDDGVDENLTILIRHSFYLYQEIILSAEFDAAFTNYCTPFLNGNQIFEEEGGNSHGMEYWNDDGNADVPKEMFNEGKNVLAVYGRDYVYGSGNQNRQWLDVQLKAEIFQKQTSPVIFGDTVTILIEGGNKGNISSDNVTINATANDTLIETLTYVSIPDDYISNIWIEWTPQMIGANRLDIEISCACNDSNVTNNQLVLNLTTQIYSLETLLDDETLIVNQTRTINTTIQLRNNGNLTDNVTLSNANPDLDDWSITFTPNNFNIEPEEIKNITIVAEIPSNYDDGNYNLSFKVESQYNYLTTRTLLESGRDSLVNWKWINSTGEEELYDNTNWTKLNFNDTEWRNANSPFGDDDVGGIDYKTYWNGDNYAYFRHVVNITDIGLYQDGVMNINIATNNYGNHYINGIYVFGDIDGGGGHGAEYWNTNIQVYINYLNQGNNIIASVVYNPQNTQWFDQEIIITFPQANLWNYKSLTYNIPIHLDSTAPATEVMEQGFYRNTSTFEINWRDLSNSDDLEGYYIYYVEKVGTSLGEWTSIGFFTNNTFNFSGENGKIYRFKSIGMDNLGNLEYKSTYDTEILVDIDTPKSELWLTEGDIRYTNQSSVSINWKPNNTNDIQSYLIQYKKDNNESWTLINEFNTMDNLRFEPNEDGMLSFRSISIDYAGNMEVKNTSDVTITFDRMRPEIILNNSSPLTGRDGLILSIIYKSENLSNIQLQYANLKESTEDLSEWTNIEGEWVDDELFLDSQNLLNGYTYYFRAIPKDLANNTCSRNPYEFTATWTNKNISLPNYPLKPVLSSNILSNMKITVDENLDGNYTTSLQEYVGNDLKFMKPNQYWIDYQNAEVVFGNKDYGYLPPANSSIKFNYEAYDVSTTIDTKIPDYVRKPTYIVEENNNVTISWKSVEDAEQYLIEYRKDLASSQWTEIETLEYSKIASDNEINYKIVNLSPGYHYYRITSIDRMGYTNSNMEGDLLEVFIENEITTVVTEENDDIVLNPFYIIPAAALLLLTALGTFYYMNKNENEEGLITPVLVPLEEANQEGTNLHEDGKEDIQDTFRLLEGSEFSREIIFICEIGCQKEFKGDKNEDEIICPNCGMMGDSPL